jgi:hypothetical protein
MTRTLQPDRYYDEPYGAGLHCILLCLDDDLYGEAVGPFERVAAHVRLCTFWLCRVESVEDAEAVQAIRYPQYRFIRDGSERYVHVGVLNDEELVDCFDRLEE